MEQWMENILRDLNSISRISILEQAFQTEKMICNYSKLLKYRWNYERKIVTASMEIDMIRMLLEFYQNKWAESFSFHMNTTSDIKSIFIPHYTILSYTTATLEFLEKTCQGNIKVILDVVKTNDHILINIQVLGKVPFDKLYESMQRDKSDSYDSIFSSSKRWNDAFGDSKINFKIKNNEYIYLSFIAYDNYKAN